MRRRPIALVAAILSLSLATGCAIVPDTPRVGREAAAQGTPVALGEPVWLGDVIVTPLRVVEDSRCPADATCVWEGRITVSTRITAAHWQQTVDLTLGEPHEVMNRRIALASAAPAKSAGQENPPGAYRFTFSGSRR